MARRKPAPVLDKAHEGGDVVVERDDSSLTATATPEQIQFLRNRGIAFYRAGLIASFLFQGGQE